VTKCYLVANCINCSQCRQLLLDIGSYSSAKSIDLKQDNFHIKANGRLLKTQGSALPVLFMFVFMNRLKFHQELGVGVLLGSVSIVRCCRELVGMRSLNSAFLYWYFSHILWILVMIKHVFYVPLYDIHWFKKKHWKKDVLRGRFH
jgi:hypothetical protein